VLKDSDIFSSFLQVYQKMSAPEKKSVFAIKKLSGQANYEEWAYGVKMLLFHERLWGYVVGEVTTAEDFEADEDRAALSIIGLSVEPSIQGHIKKVGTSKEAWEKLEETFGVTGGTRGQISALSELVNTKLTDCKDMTDFINKMVTISQKFKNENFSIDELVGSFMLIGLTPSYRPLTMVLDHSNSKITTDSVTSSLLHEEARRSLEDGQESPSALAVRKQGKKQTWKKKTPEAETKNPHPHANLECGYCHQKGHIKKNCFKLQNLKHKTQPSVNQREPQALLTALGVSTANVNTWVVDSGADKHYCIDSSMFAKYQKVRDLEVTVANNDKVQVHGTGHVPIQVPEGNRVIQNATYVPDLSNNLLSVPAIVDKDLVVVFSKDHCQVFKNFSSEGDCLLTADKSGGLFKLNTKPISVNAVHLTETQDPKVEDYPEKVTISDHDFSVQSDEKVSLWHRRMGHINNSDLKSKRS